MLRRFSLRRAISAAGLLRPRVINRVAAQADRARRDVKKIAEAVTELTRQVQGVASQLESVGRVLEQQGRSIDVLTQLQRFDAIHRGEIAECEVDLQADV